MSAAVLLAAGLLAAGRAEAADAAAGYPSRPIRFIVTYAPGGGTDLVARLVGQKLTERWGQQVVVDNRAGAGGVIGTDLAAKAAPDGYTLLLGTAAGLVINPLLTPGLPYDAARDFAPVSLLVVNPQLLVVHPTVAAASVQELVALAKRMPGRLAYASAGPGSPNHIGTELFKMLTGTDLLHVPYKGSGATMSDLLAGQVQVIFNPMAPLLPHVRAGRLRALAVGSAQRSRTLPELPTVAESGVPGFESAPWYSAVVPARTPGAIVGRLNARIVEILSEPDVAARLLAAGAEPQPGSPADLTRYIDADRVRTERVIRAAGLRAAP